MYEKSHESVSSMMDGEIEEFELRRLVQQMGTDDDMQKKWQRYHLSLNVLKGADVQLPKNLDLVGRVSAALENEPALGLNSTTPSQAAIKENAAQSVNEKDDGKIVWWKPLTSMAVAASVTAVVILGGQQISPFTAAVDDPTQLAAIEKGAASDGFMQAQFGAQPTLSNESVAATDVIHNGYGMGQYIQQYRDLVDVKPAAWQVSWLPTGFKKVEHKVSSSTELFVYSDGKDTVTINVEPLGAQMASQGVVNEGNILALGKRADQSFITVVGPVSETIAQKIVQSVKAKNNP